MILPLEQQVTSLALSKRLKALGVRQDSLFNWTQEGGFDKWELRFQAYTSRINATDVEHYAAFIVAELGEMLPKEINKARPYKLQCYKSSEGWRVDYWAGFNGSRDFRAGADNYADTEAEARGLMLEYLVKNKLIEV